MGRIVLPAPSETQRKFLEEKHKYVAFGGARGGGKSWAIRTKAILLSLRYPGITILIIRRTYPELRANHITPLLKMLPTNLYRYNDSHKEITLKNGSKIVFRFCAGDKDLPLFQGLECDVMFIDEATQFSETQYLVLKACVRGANGYPKRIFLSCNPGGIGHVWVKRLFVDREFEGAERPEEYAFIQSRVYDNKILMKYQPDYVSQLETLDARHRSAWLEGNWDIYEGVFFEEFRDDPDHYDDHRFTHVINPFEIPTNWRIYRSFDWGYSKPFSCGWWAVNEDNVAYRILELYGCTKDPDTGVKWDANRVFAEIRKIETEQRWLRGREIEGVADPAIFASQTGDSVADIAAQHGVYFAAGDNSRINGWLEVHRRMSFNEDGRAMLYVFKNCRAFIRTMPGLVYDEYRVEDLDTTGEDHVADEVRYFCMTRPVGPSRIKAEDDYNLTPQAMYLDVAREDLTVRPPRGERMEIINSEE